MNSKQFFVDTIYFKDNYIFGSPVLHSDSGTLKIFDLNPRFYKLVVDDSTFLVNKNYVLAIKLCNEVFDGKN